MTTKTCDRCGAEIREFSWRTMKFPAYSVRKADANIRGVVPIDLCRKCQDDFTEWLNGSEQTYVKLRLRGENPLACYSEYYKGAKYVVIDTCAKNDTRDYGAYWYEGEEEATP